MGRSHDFESSLKTLELHLMPEPQRRDEYLPLDAGDKIHKVRQFILWSKGPGLEQVLPRRHLLMARARDAARHLVEIIALAAYAKRLERADKLTIEFMVKGVCVFSAALLAETMGTVPDANEYEKWAAGVLTRWSKERPPRQEKPPRKKRVSAD